MSGRYVYHYCAHYQDGMNMYYIDGILQLENKVSCMEEYNKLKPQIETKHHGKLTISSLSFIGMEFDVKQN